jgi:Predicted membrane protein (DUF2339)
MEGLFLLTLIVLAVAAIPVVAIIALVRTASLRGDIQFLQRQVSRLGDQMAELRRAARGDEGFRRGEGEQVGAEEAEGAEGAEAEGPDEPSDGEAARDERDTDVAEDADEDGAADRAELEPALAESDAETAAGRAPEPATAALDFETRLGTTWVLRIGLGVLAIALALFARNVAPQLSPGAKVVVAYLGAVAMFAAGKYWEERLERFARPVMAGALAFGFFVAFAAHFVPAMQAISLPVSLAWMALSMAAILVVAERWRSQPTAGLAILLGNVSAFVAAGDADAYSLVIIGFLALTAIVLLLRHGWLTLGVFAVAVSYGTHVLWILAERAPITGEQGFWLNLAFLTSYYVIFLIADVLWFWRHGRGDLHDGDPGHGDPGHGDPDHTTAAQVASARALGPANLVLYVSVTSFVYFVSEAGIESIEWYFLTLGALQPALTWFHHRMHGRDFVFYPAFGAVLWTLGFFASLDALALNLVLAGQALLLLIVAHRTRLWVFHALAQVALVVAFVHYVAYPQPALATWPMFLGGVGLVLVYLLKASLEEIWYAEGESVEWEGSGEENEASDSGDASDAGDARGVRARLVEEFPAFFTPLAPRLSYFHAALGGVILLRETIRFYGFEMGTVVFVSVAQLLVILAVLARRRIALLATHTVVAAGSIFLAAGLARPLDALVFMGALTLSALLLLHFGAPRLEGRPARNAAVLAQWTVWLVLGAVFVTLLGPDSDIDFGLYLPWMGLAAVMFALQERLLSAYAGFEEGDEYRLNALRIGVVTSVVVAFPVTFVTARAIGMEVVAPVLIALWSVALFGAAGLRHSRGLFAGGYALLVSGYYFFVLDQDLLAAVLSSWWAGVIVIVVPLALAMGLDRMADPDDPWVAPEDLVWAGAATYGAYGIGFTLVGEMGRFHLPPIWSLLGPSLLGLVLIHASGRLRTSRAVVASVVGVVLLNALYLQRATVGPNVDEVLLPVLLLSAVTLAVERGVARRGLAGATPQERRIVEAGLVVLAALMAMVGIYQSALFGALWATAGWTAVAAVLVGMGFGLKSALYRRVGLALLGVGLLRVFLFDTRGLSGTAQTAAFFVLGLVLVGVAWLYAHFSKEIKSWL